MAIAAAADALTTVENVKTYMNKTGDNTPDTTAKLQIFINSYSRAIHRYTGRQFLPASTQDEAKIFPYSGDSYLSLAPTEAIAVTSVVLYTDLPQASWVTLAPQSATVEALYRLEPRKKTPEGTYLWMTLPELGQFSPLVREPVVTRRARGHQVTITGRWGAGSVPADVELACLIAVSNAARNPEGFASRSLAQFAVTELPELAFADESGMSLPRDARALLSPYRRTAFG